MSELRSAVPTGRVKWYDAAKGFGFVTSDEGGDVFLPKGALPAEVAELKTGQRIEFGVVDSRKGAQAMGVKLIDAPPSLAELRRRPAEELHSMVEDMIKVLESQVQPGLSRGRYPDKRVAQKIAQLVHAVAKEFEV